MKAAFISKYGKDQILTIGERPLPAVLPSDVLVKIHAASLNPIDFKTRNGMLRFFRPYSFPLILGHDCAGEVIQVGSQVTQFKVGDLVYSRPGNGRIGTLAEFIAIDQSEVALKPKNLSAIEAASLPLVALTSWQALVDVVKLHAGQKILIQAGSGGVGSFAIQLAKHLGAEVWTTTSGKNEELVKSFGADHIINYQKEKFEDGGRKFDVVFDTLGGEALDKSFQVIKPGGSVVSISGLPDHRTAKSMGTGLVGAMVLWFAGLHLNWKASRVGAHYRFIFMQSFGHQLAEVAALVEAGQIKPVVDQVFPLAEAQKALEYSESGRARGKIVVQIASN